MGDLGESETLFSLSEIPPAGDPIISLIDGRAHSLLNGTLELPPHATIILDGSCSKFQFENMTVEGMLITWLLDLCTAFLDSLHHSRAGPMMHSIAIFIHMGSRLGYLLLKYSTKQLVALHQLSLRCFESLLLQVPGSDKEQTASSLRATAAVSQACVQIFCVATIFSCMRMLKLRGVATCTGVIQLE